MALPIGLLRPFTKTAKHLFAYAEAHTGLPAIVVAAIVLVVGFRLFKKSLRFAVEVAVVVGLLGAASFFGWVRF